MEIVKKKWFWVVVAVVVLGLIFKSNSNAATNSKKITDTKLPTTPAPKIEPSNVAASPKAPAKPKASTTAGKPAMNTAAYNQDLAAWMNTPATLRNPVGPQIKDYALGGKYYTKKVTSTVEPANSGSSFSLIWH